jgi:hypothetical protein
MAEPKPGPGPLRRPSPNLNLNRRSNEVQIRRGPVQVRTGFEPEPMPKELRAVPGGAVFQIGTVDGPAPVHGRNGTASCIILVRPRKGKNTQNCQAVKLSTTTVDFRPSVQSHVTQTA